MTTRSQHGILLQILCGVMLICMAAPNLVQATAGQTERVASCSAFPGVYTDPGIIVTHNSTETVLRKELSGYGCYGQYDNAADIVYTQDSHDWSFRLPDGIPPSFIAGAYFVVSLIADNQSTNSPPVSEYTMDVSVNGAPVYSGLANIQHGIPLNACMQYTQWVQQSFPVASLSQTTTLGLKNTSNLCPANAYWIGVDWIELHIPCTSPDGQYSNPPVVTTTRESGWQTPDSVLSMELSGYPCYGQLDNAADIEYPQNSHEWAFSVPGALLDNDHWGYFKVYLMADNQSSYSMSLDEYTMQFAINGTLVYSGRAQVQHGTPTNACMQYTQWTYREFQVPQLLPTTTLRLTNTSHMCPANMFWLGIDRIELHILPGPRVPVRPTSWASVKGLYR